MEHISDLFDLQVDQQTRGYLNETARWAKFLSVIGFIMCAILVIIGLSAGTILSTLGSASSELGGMFAMGSMFFAVIYILIALLYFFPCLYLYRFGAKMKIALAAHDQQRMNESFKNLKSCFRYMGILTIIVLAFYVLALLLGIMNLVAK